MNRDKHPKTGREKSGKRELQAGMPADFWTRIAEDAAHGYGAHNDPNRNPQTRLNEDQLPGDNERG
jgi:hypothetical protein